MIKDLFFILLEGLKEFFEFLFQTAVKAVVWVSMAALWAVMITVIIFIFKLLLF